MDIPLSFIPYTNKVNKNVMRYFCCSKKNKNKKHIHYFKQSSNHEVSRPPSKKNASKVKMSKMESIGIHEVKKI
jgi:hypothetical protein